VFGRVTGYDRDLKAATGAEACGALDEIARSAPDAARDADLVVLAAPVGASAGLLEAIAPALKADAIVTDVGSTKRDVMAAAARHLPAPARFVGGHPIAGAERSGPSAAHDALFDGRLCVLTPTANTEGAALAACESMWRGVGAQVRHLDAQVHDSIFALTSHLPHAAAFALAAVVAGGAPGAILEGFAGAGFQDTTRIAGSDATMWRDIFVANADSVMPLIAALASELAALSAAIGARDGAAIERMIERAHQGRARVLARKPSGA
jgi:prephenate dehydrogenase